MKYTGIIILQYNNWKDTINCIKSIQQHNSAPIKLIIVDNASPDKEAVTGLSDFLKKEYHENLLLIDDNTANSCPEILPSVTFYCSQVNDGYARGNNKGLRLALKDSEIHYTLILNNDTLFVEDILPRLINDVDSIPDCAFITPLLYKRDLVTLDRNCARHPIPFWNMLLYYLFVLRTFPFMNKQVYYNFKPMNGLKQVELISGSCMFSSKNLMKSIEGFDPNTFLYYEENILWEKVHKLVLKNYVDTNLSCIHLGGTTIKKSISVPVLKLMFKSHLYFVKYYMKHGLLKGYVLSSVQIWALTLLRIRKIFK